MYAPKKLQLNKYQCVKCPTQKDLYQRIGPRVSNPSNFSHDGSGGSPVDMNMSTMDILRKMSQDERTNLYNEYVEEQRKLSEQASREQADRQSLEAEKEV